jgi:small-conductance mechanosensitive channel
LKVVSFLFNRRTGFVLLGVVLIALTVGVYLTRIGNANSPDAAIISTPSSPGSVDQSPLSTARRLAAEAHGPAEQQKAAQALRFADHEVDQAFETALREATADTTPLKGEPLAISQKIVALEKKVEAEKQRVADLTTAQAKAADQDDAAQQVELAQAQLDLDNDELNDLHQDLIRMGGDKHAKVQQALDEHEAAQKQPVAVSATNATAELAQSIETLPGQIRALLAITKREKELRQADAEAKNGEKRLTQQHEALEKATESPAAPSVASSGNSNSTNSTTASIATLHALSSQRKTMMEYDARIHDEQQLAAIYQSWAQIAQASRRSVLHGILRALAIIVAILLAVLLAIAVIRRQFAKRIENRRRLGHLRIVVELIVELIALGIILIVIFGTPTEMPAILGLVTAGVTIVMKDFIVAFIGWFPLMGKNGIRVGDWVEIDGVSGEVVEIGMLRTVLLETGNLAGAGHPTGRRVTFMNSFAIEGRYFNFSTSGQWLWDELRVTVPLGDDAYGRIEAIRKLITDVTEQDAAIAEDEWRQATKDEALRGFSAAPAIDLRPASDGIEVTVRNITRAQKRYELRSSPYQDVIRLLHSEEVAQLAGKVQA